jgi:hypothetical protein
VKTGKKIFFFQIYFTSELTHFFERQKIQKTIFFLLDNLITFGGHKIQKNIFGQKTFWKTVFLEKNIFLNFLSPKSD